MTTSIKLSPKIIQEVFGHEFASLLEARLTESEQAGKSAPKDNIERLFSDQPHVEDNNDGVKPSKSPRTANVPASQQLSVDVGDPLLPFRNIFRKRAGLSPQKRYAQAPPPSDTLGELMNERLKMVASTDGSTSGHNQEGRLGPKTTKFDVAAHFGSFVLTADRLGITSQCNFGSVRANVCLFKGKWQYEIQLQSKGVMQLGWATLSTRFSQEKGVGDSKDSFAYDGNRLRKWNGTTSPYGEGWQSGDIIGCLIDLNEGSIEFCRNGKNLGKAFTNIPRGPGISYFPAVSLAWGESIMTNFGATPFQFPAPGHLPIQVEIPVENTQVPLLFNWLDNIIRVYPDPNAHASPSSSKNLNMSREDYETLLIATNRVFQFLAPSMNSAFIVEQTFLPFYANKVGLPEKVEIHDQNIIPPPESHEKVHLLLDLMWGFLEETEMKKCLERMCTVFVNSFRSNSLSLAYPFQIYSLRCLIALSSHRRSRRHLIHHILFDEMRLIQFLHIRPVDDETLKVLIPNAGWTAKAAEGTPEAVEHNNQIKNLRAHIQAVEEVQMQFLRTLLSNTDGTNKRPSSRSVFLRKFRAYIRDSSRPGTLGGHPINRALCGFFRMLKMSMILWKEEIEPDTDSSLIPTSTFFDMTLDYQDTERLGGISNYLYKTYHAEVSAALNVPDYMMTGNQQQPHQDTPMPSFFGFPDLRFLPLGSVSTPAVTSADGSNSQATTSMSVSGGNLLQNIDDIQVSPSDAPPSAVSVGVGRSESNAASQQSTSFGLIVDEPTTGSITPQVGFLHPPTQGSFPRNSRTENVPNLRVASATSSAEEMAAVVPRMTALIGGTNSGTNMMIPVFDIPRMAAFRLLPGGLLGFSTFDRVGVRPNTPAATLVNRDSGVMDGKTSIRELMDDCVMIFSCGVKKHIEKIVTLRKNTEEYLSAVQRAQAALTREGLKEEERVELERSIEVFTKKLDEQSRHMTWVESGVFTQERQKLSFELLKVVLKTLQTASGQGILFVFVPEFYVTTMIHLTWLILNQFHPTVSYDSLPGIDNVLKEVAEFVSLHFNDNRIVTADTKDTLTQALSSFICDEKMLSCLEEIPEASRKRMVKSLLRPYENRAWAQNNWMLVRIWQGSGYAFRYPVTTQARKAFRSRPNQDEYGMSTTLPPRPSAEFQRLVALVLMENPKLASNYVHSILNQLNWAFSEFVGLLQEIYNGASRNERAFMEMRQLKICCTCHELTQSLLRVIEMIAQKCPDVLTDHDRESTETLLTRLFVLLSQVLNRIGSTSGTFAQVIELGISGIENITYFPILTSVAGILVALFEPELEITDASKLITTKTLLREPSFQVASLGFFLGRNIPEDTPSVLKFSLRNYVTDEDITETEIERLEKVIQHIESWSQRLETDNESISDDEVCTICYAYPKSATLKPCNHRSCRACILHHLMNRGECFFCKGTIEKVVADTGEILFDVNAIEPDASDSESTVGFATERYQ